MGNCCSRTAPEKKFAKNCGPYPQAGSQPEKAVDASSFVKSLRLISSGSARDGNDDGTSNSDGAGAQINAGSVVSFTSRMTAQQKDDVQNGCMLAQLAASYKYNRNTNCEEWYDFYFNVLQNIGWVDQEHKFEKEEITVDNVKIPQLVVDMVMTMVEGWSSEDEISQIIQNTMKALSMDNDGLQLYQENSSNENLANFQIMTCDNKQGEVTMPFSGSQFTATIKDHNYFFVEWESTSIQLYSSNDTMILDTSVYEQVRQDIIDKLGDSSHTFVHDLKIS